MENKARIRFIVLIIASLLKVQNVNYQRLAESFDSDVELSATLRRIQRFFASFDLNSDLVAHLIVNDGKLRQCLKPLSLVDGSSLRFNLKNTYLTDYQRLNKLLFIVALAFIWAYKVGIYRNDKVKKIKIKNMVDLRKASFHMGLNF